MKILSSMKSVLTIFAVLLLLGTGAVWHWQQSQKDALPEGLVSGNGRIEADQVDIAAKSASRIREVLVEEGDMVSAGQVLAHLDTTELQAERAKYVADLAAQQASFLEAKATVAQRRSISASQ